MRAGQEVAGVVLGCPAGAVFLCASETACVSPQTDVARAISCQMRSARFMSGSDIDFEAIPRLPHAFIRLLQALGEECRELLEGISVTPSVQVDVAGSRKV